MFNSIDNLFFKIEFKNIIVFYEIYIFLFQ